MRNACIQSSNQHRIDSAQSALETYDGADDERLIDLLADLLHFCDASGLDFDHALKLARTHSCVERDAPPRP